MLKFAYIKKAALLVLFLALLVLPSFASADTIINSSNNYISEDTVWNMAGSPYILFNTVWVRGPATLTIEPGVIVKFAGNYSGINVFDGNIVAEGTAENPIYFTSINDSSIGSWGLNIARSPHSSFSHLNMRYSYGGIFMWDSIVLVDNINIENSDQGVAMAGRGELTVTNSTFKNIENNAIAGYQNSSLIISDVRIENIWEWEAIMLSDNSHASIKNSSVKDVNFAFALGLYGNSYAEVENSIFSGGLNYGIALITRNNKPTLVLRDSVVEEYFGGGINIFGGEAQIERSVIRNNMYGVWAKGIYQSTISGSSIYGNLIYAIDSRTIIPINAKNNWWGDESGPFESNKNPDGFGDEISGNVDFIPWLTEDPNVEIPECCSNVLFLPGLEASRLYKQGILSEDRLWEPNINSDVIDLYLNQDGQSVNNVYTEDIVDKALGISPIYDSFIKKMNQLVIDKNIKWQPYAYDWRQSVDDIVNNGTKYKDGQKSLIATLEELVNSSATKKVTIVAHSNGGLLAKALIVKLQELKNSGTNNLIDKIDNVVLIASPQIGTPEATFALLHGYNQNILGGLLMNSQTARRLAINMPSGYGLLPSDKYYQISTTPIISFDPNSDLSQIYTNYYGNEINSFAEQNDFILGKEGRTNPEMSDTILPIIGNKPFLDRGQELHNKIDNLIIPSNIKLIQLAGWGKDTLVGMKYVEKTICSYPIIGLNMCIPNKILDLRPVTDMNGDKTVVAPSALHDDQGEKYWLDLSSSKIEHKNIFEDNSVLQFVENIVNQNTLAIDRIYQLKPTYTKIRNKISVHSPVTLGAYDLLGNFTGKICPENSDFCQVVEDIPNSLYMEFGEGKYLSADEENINKVILRGTDIGIFTYESETFLPTGESTTVAFTDIPVTLQTTAEITINPNTQTQELKLDVDSDGTTDITIQPNNQFDPIVYLQVMRKTIENSDITESRKNGFINRIDATIKEIQKGKIDKAKLKTEKFMHVLGTIIDKKEPKKPKPHRLSGAETEQLLIMLDQLLINLNK